MLGGGFAALAERLLICQLVARQCLDSVSDHISFALCHHRRSNLWRGLEKTHTCFAQEQLDNLGSHPRTYHPSHHAPNTHILTPPTRPGQRLGPYAPVARSCPSILLGSRLIAAPRVGWTGLCRRLDRLETAIHCPLTEVRDGCTADERYAESDSCV